MGRRNKNRCYHNEWKFFSVGVWWNANFFWTALKISAGRHILMQQNLILAKADTLPTGGAEEEKVNAQAAKVLIEKSRNIDSIALSSNKILYPAE